MKVFISHTFSETDLKLAKILESILNEKNIDSYLAEDRREYNKLIRDKIMNEIKDSDHMVAILSTDGSNSASVNQELGYALREGISPIIMVEDGATQGVLIFGLDTENFTKENFAQSCSNVLQHIINQGKRIRNAENLNQIMEKLEEMSSKPVQPQIITQDNEKVPNEEIWYREIMNVEFNPFNQTQKNARMSAKRYYSKIKILKSELTDLRIKLSTSSIYDQVKIENDISVKEKDLSNYMEWLASLWAKHSSP